MSQTARRWLATAGCIALVGYAALLTHLVRSKFPLSSNHATPVQVLELTPVAHAGLSSTANGMHLLQLATPLERETINVLQAGGTAAKLVWGQDSFSARSGEVSVHAPIKNETLWRIDAYGHRYFVYPVAVRNADRANHFGAVAVWREPLKKLNEVYNGD